MWPPAPVTDAGFAPPRGHGTRTFSEDVPLTCWLSVKLGLTPHGLRHSHKTWMAEDGIPEILAEQRLGHEVPGMRGLYTHASDRMRGDLKAALQARWADSLRARAAIHECSPVPLLDELLSSFVARAANKTVRHHQSRTEGQQPPPDRTARHREAGRR
jgi:Phage integrase family